MKHPWVKAMVLVAVVLVGCGDKSPADKCEDLVSSICDRAVDCVPGTSGMHDACVDAFHQQLSCSATKSISASYDGCLDDLDHDSCEVLFPVDSETGEPTIQVPAVCNSALVMGSALGAVDRVSYGSVPAPLAATVIRAHAAVLPAAE